MRSAARRNSRTAGLKWKPDFTAQSTLVATIDLRGTTFGGSGGMMEAGRGGHWGTWETRSRQACRPFGDISAHRSAFFRNSTRSFDGMLANCENARKHWIRWAGGRLLKVSKVF